MTIKALEDAIDVYKNANGQEPALIVVSDVLRGDLRIQNRMTVKVINARVPDSAEARKINQALELIGSPPLSEAEPIAREMFGDSIIQLDSDTRHVNPNYPELDLDGPGSFKLYP